MQYDLERELMKAQLEIARHHRHFAQIGAIVDKALAKAGLPGSHARMAEALGAIKKIVN